MTLRNLIAVCIYALAASVAARAEIQPEAVGQVERLKTPFHPHWVWVSDLVLERSALIDLDAAKFLGLVNGGYGTIAPLFPRRRPEIYLAATYYARRTRGARTDVLEIHDAATLAPLAEVVLPPKRGIDAVALAHAALSDDERFVAVFNWTPGTSLSIVDVERRTFAGEIEIGGCSLVYAVGRRSFLSLCADGAALRVTLDADGHEAARKRSEPFFDPHTDPVTEKAVRYGNEWLFVSFDGKVHPVDASGEDFRVAATWSLFDDADREAQWRVGGNQHLAVHAASGRLYSLVHRGGPDTHKDPGEEVWVYDLRTRRRVERIVLRSPGFTVYGFPIAFGQRWPRPFNRLSDWLLDTFAPAMVSHIQVTQDAQPLLVTASQFSGGLGLYDARDGHFRGRVPAVGWTTDLLLAPGDGQTD